MDLVPNQYTEIVLFDKRIQFKAHIINWGTLMQKLFIGIFLSILNCDIILSGVMNYKA